MTESLGPETRISYCAFHVSMYLLFTDPCLLHENKALPKRQKEIEFHTPPENSIHINSFYLLWRKRLTDRIGSFLLSSDHTPSFVKSWCQSQYLDQTEVFQSNNNLWGFFQTACKNNDPPLSFLLGLQMIFDDNCTWEILFLFFFFNWGCMEIEIWVWKSAKFVCRFHET